MRNCPHCGKEIESNVTRCRYCLEAVEDTTTRQGTATQSYLINCPDCSKEISPEAEKCPNCGKPLKSKKKLYKGGGCLMFLAGIFLCLLSPFIGGIVAFLDL